MINSKKDYEKALNKGSLFFDLTMVSYIGLFITPFLMLNSNVTLLKVLITLMVELIFAIILYKGKIMEKINQDRINTYEKRAIYKSI